jgi:hypothetical protein
MITDIQCECCGRWITESEDSFVLRSKSCCKTCKSKPDLMASLGKMLQRGVVRVLSLLV